MAVNPFDIWKDKTVRVFFTSGNGDQNLEGNTDPNKFTLRALAPFIATGASCTPFFVEFDPGQLPPYWHLVLLVPRGDQEARPDNVLPPLDILTAADVTTSLRSLIADVDNEGTRVRRLEGFIPVVTGDPLNLKFDEVRMVYLEKAMKDKDDPNNPNKRLDYVYINFRTVMGMGPKPNGGGSGPPDG